MTTTRKPATVPLVALIAALVVALVAGGLAVTFYLTRSPRQPVGAQQVVDSNAILGNPDLPIVQALERRNSTTGGNFTNKTPDDDTLVALAWAATGKNRDGTGFVIPLAMGADPYVSVYTATGAGVAKFDWRTNTFTTITPDDVRNSIVTQAFAKQVPAMMLFVIDTSLVPSQNTDWGYIAVGAMTQDVYLLADEINVQTRFVASIDRPQVTSLLKLTADQVPVGAILLAAK